MGDHGPLGGGDPFGGLPFLGDLMRMLAAQGPSSWDAARQLAISIATEGRSEPNVDPAQRLELEELGRVADLHVARHTGLPTAPGGRTVRVVPVNRTVWAQRTLDAWRPLLERLANSLSPSAPPPTTDPDDPTAAMLGPLMQVLAPMMLSMTAGSLVGHLATRSLGTYDLPVPRPETGELLVVLPNVDRFEREWSLPAQELRLWVCLHEIAHHTVLGVPHVGRTLTGLLEQFASGFRSDPTALSEHLGGLDPQDPSSMERLEQLLGDPEIALGAVQSDEQRALLPRIGALVTAVVGYVDHVMDQVGTTLMPSYAMLTEALRRRRVEADRSDRLVEHILGLNLTQDEYDRGTAFVAGIVERAGEEGLARLWESEATIPTPAEVDAPGLWLARIDLPLA